MKKISFKREYFAFPYAFISIVFVLIPLVILLVYAFSYNGSFSFINFVKFVQFPHIWSILANSLGMAFLTTVICFALAYPLALMLSVSRINKSSAIAMMFILPMWINSLLRIYAIKTILPLIHLSNGYPAVLIGMVYDFFPFMLLPLYTVLSNMDKSYIEASQDLGASPVPMFFKVVLPLSVPGIISGVLMVFMPTISTFAISEMLGTAEIYMFGNLINDYFSTSATWNLGSAFALIMLVLIAVSMLIANRLTSKNKKEEASPL